MTDQAVIPAFSLSLFSGGLIIRGSFRITNGSACNYLDGILRLKMLCPMEFGYKVEELNFLAKILSVCSQGITSTV